MLYWVIIAIIILLGFVPVVLAYNSRYYPIKLIKPYLWLLALASFYEGLFSYILDLNAKYWLATYSFLEFFVLGYFYNGILNKRYQNFILGSVAVYTILGLLAFLFVGKSITVDSYMTCAETVFIYIFTILWFKDLFLDLNIKSLWHYPTFYFVSAFLLYFSGVFFLFLLTDVIKVNPETDFEEYGELNVFLTLVLRILIIIGIWKARKV